MVIATDGIANLTQPQGDDIEDTARGVKGDFLIKSRHSDAISKSNVTIIGNDAPINQFKER